MSVSEQLHLVAHFVDEDGECYSDCESNPTTTQDEQMLKPTPSNMRNIAIAKLFAGITKGIPDICEKDSSMYHKWRRRILNLIIDLEDRLNEEYGLNNIYREKIRSLIFNFNDINNKDLKRRFLEGELTSAELIHCRPRDLASDQRRTEDDRLIKERFNEAFMATDREAETDMFQCSRCKERKTKYSQLQTRSADEPMTTFVTCVNCGHRWKFS